MKRKPSYPLTTNQREALFNERSGICWRCGHPINRLYERWHVGHGFKDGLGRACGGSDEWENLAPEHKDCNLGHAAQMENTLAAKIKRVRHMLLGNREQSPWSKKLEAYRWNWKTRRYEPHDPH